MRNRDEMKCSSRKCKAVNLGVRRMVGVFYFSEISEGKKLAFTS